VGTSCAKSMLLRGSCHKIVLIDKDKNRAQGVATDLSHGELLCPPTTMLAGDYDDLTGSSIVVITAGINEQAGKAIKRADNLGRLRLLPHNAKVYKKILPKLTKVAPNATILVVTDPPDPLSEIALQFTTSDKVISAGTFLDSLRFRLQIARQLGCHPSSVNAQVIGEHGTSQVYVWSSAQIGGQSILDYVASKKLNAYDFQRTVEEAVRYANIDIIEGTGASQHGIGIVTARLVEAILRNEGLVAPVGKHHPGFSVTLSLPSIIGHGGISKVIEPALSDKERDALQKSAKAIVDALSTLV
ncbi:MAG: lactate dehydrogenase, partial [Phycisphaerae bacterium]|nr:lactate dehydrogenase [Phycisphaerae bacterium]NIU55209.1 lactate dehydrogenase [Phycisphaerae bacterium]NIW91887.1 lactate dehydrogenase [Phycisphaerae bacterium]NIX26515.1 lactate dehydrogenase [Phycisphaerae bacterium]